MFFLPLLLLLLCLSGCTPEPYEHSEPQMVVEGWIDSGGYPQVFVTTTMNVNGREDNDLASHLLKWARVTVDDGTKEVVLTGKYMTNCVPPYGFTSTEIKGESGRTYRLTVDCPPYHAEATTTIPPVPEIDSISVALRTDNDTLYEANVCLSRNTNIKGGYKLFAMRKHKDNYHLSCYMGTYKSELLKLPARLPIFNVHRMSNDEFIPNFSLSDTVSVKVAAIDNTALLFWNDFERNVSLSKNPFLSPDENLRGNVEGALGYWFGYGCNYHIVVPPTQHDR